MIDERCKSVVIFDILKDLWGSNMTSRLKDLLSGIGDEARIEKPNFNCNMMIKNEHTMKKKESVFGEEHYCLAII